MLLEERSGHDLDHGVATQPRDSTSLLLVSTLALAITIATAGQATPQPAKLGSEFQVNTYTTNDQEFADVAVRPDGSFVVVWKSPGSNFFDNNLTSIQARRYDAGGVALTQDLEVNTYWAGFQNRPRVAVGSAGDFVVVWQSDGSDDLTNRDTSGYSVQARRYSSGGSPIGIDFQVNSYTTGNQFYPSVAMGLGSEFVVAWLSIGSPDSDQDSSSVLARRFDGSGTPLGSDFQVNTHTQGFQDHPDVATTPAGGFVVVWDSYTSPGNDPALSVQARRYAADGSALGDQFQVNTFTSGYQYGPDVATGPDGEFVVVWDSSLSPADSDYGIRARRFAADGSPAGGELQANAYVTGAQQNPDVAIASDGTFVVTWTSDSSTGTDSSLFSVQARHFAADGTPWSPDFQVNTYTPLHQYSSAIDFGPDSVFVVVWTSFGSSGAGAPVLDSNGKSVQGQLFDSAAIFLDDFESGDVSAWAGATP